MSNDDIVTRLRDEVCECGYSASFNELHKCLRCEVADEIERLRTDRDKWRKVADELYLSGNCSETCVDGAGGYDCSCSWGGAEWEYQQAVRGE